MRYGLREVCDVTFYDLNTNAPMFYLDSLKMTDLTMAAKTVDAVGGKGGNRLLSWDFGRTMTFDVQDALLNPTSLAALTGNTLATGAQSVYKRELLTVANSTDPTPVPIVTLSQPPSPTSSVQVFTTDDGYDQTKSLVSGTDYTLTGTKVTFQGVSATVGSQVIVYYTYQSGSTAQLIEVTSDMFPGYYKIVGDTLVRNDSTGEDEPFQLIITKAKLLPGFKLTLQAEGNAATVFDFKLESYKPSNDTLMMQMIKY